MRRRPYTRYLLAGLLLATLALAPLGALAPVAAPSRGAISPRVPASVTVQRAAFRSHFGLGLGRRRGYGYGRRSRTGLLHRIVRTAIWIYVLHLFFSHGGLSILLWIVVIGFVISLMRRRRRRYA